MQRALPKLRSEIMYINLDVTKLNNSDLISNFVTFDWLSF